MFSDYAPSVASRDPPPRYQEVYTVPTPPVSTPGPSIASRYVAPLPWPIRDERSALLPKHEPKRRRVLRLICAVLGFILLVILILQNLSLISCPLDDVSASDKRAIRRQWKAQMKDHDLLAKQWAVDREQHALEMHQWEDERAQWREERNRWEEERKSEERHRKEVERRRQGVYWTDSIGDAHCSAYSTRVYRATLKDIPHDLNWLEVCSDMPNTVHDRPVDRPDSCQPNDQGEMQASWLVNWDEPGCVPYWDKIQYKRCAPGKPGIAHVEARLWGMNNDENWETMCATTPGQIDGRDIGHPISCVNWGIFAGMVGTWEVPAKWC